MLGGQPLVLTGDSHRLFVFQGIPNLQIGLNPGELQVPRDAFAHTDPSAVVRLEARLADGRPLPEWLRFDGVRGVFSDMPPQDAQGLYEIEVLARDTAGREARTRFALLVEELRVRRAGEGEAADAVLGLDVDKKEAEKARLENRPTDARPAKGPMPAEPRLPARDAAASFSEQLRAARAARDPLLAKITKGETGKPTPRR